jgi:hypothetical protein
VFLVGLMSLGAGFFNVPLVSYMQHEVKGSALGQILAYNNMVSFIFILLASGIFALLEMSLGTRSVFLFCSATSLMASWVVYKHFIKTAWYKLAQP